MKKKTTSKYTILVPVSGYKTIEVVATSHEDTFKKIYETGDGDLINVYTDNDPINPYEKTWSVKDDKGVWKYFDRGD